jgi:hypothetical protein
MRADRFEIDADRFESFQGSHPILQRFFSFPRSTRLAFDRPFSRGRYRDPNDLDRFVSSLHHLTLFCGKPGPDQAGDHVTFEPMGDDKQFHGGTVRTAGEQL